MNGDINKRQPYKVKKDGLQVGIVAKNFAELKKKGCSKLEIPLKELGDITLTDGTIVDDEYFSALPQNAVFLFKTKKDCDIQTFMRKTQEVHDLSTSIEENDLQEYVAKIQGDPLAVNVLKYLSHLTGNPAEHRDEDEEWFEGLPSKYKTKCQVLRDKATKRVRSYYNLTKTKLLPGDKGLPLEDDTDSSEDAVDKERATEVLVNFRDRLKEENYQRELFDRNDTTNKRCCDTTGKFDCQGAYNKDACHAQHQINPYVSKDALVEFSSWNLDHQIEKSKEVIPRLKEAVSGKHAQRQINWEYFYDMLFTMENLKLVHTSCHDKTNHNLTIDRSKMFKK